MRTLDQLAHFARISTMLGLAVILGGCNQGAKGDPNAAVAVTTLAITGTPATSVVPGQAYFFQPTVVATGSSTISFSITNKPGWLTLDTTNGHLSGQPSSADVGTYPDLELSVHNATGSAALPKFAIAVRAMEGGSGTGSATLSWTSPTTNANGTALTDLAGFRIYYGNSPDSLTQSITIATPDTTNFVISNLGTGTWYFALLAYNSLQTESALSAVVSKTI